MVLHNIPPDLFIYSKNIMKLTKDQHINALIDEALMNLEELDEWIHNNQTIAVCEAIYHHKLYYQEMISRTLESVTIH